MNSRPSSNFERRLELRPIDGTPEELRELQRVLESAPDYAMKVLGHPQRPEAAQTLYDLLPPGVGYEDKFVFGLYDGDEMIGCVDLIRGYPDSSTAMLGLLLLAERNQKRGLGREAYSLIEKQIRRWSKTNTIRLAILESNILVRPFWEKMGFVATGECKPYEHESLRSQLVVFAKPVVPDKKRYTLRTDPAKDLAKVDLPEKWPTLKVTPDLVDELGLLMARAYRGSIDDDGEGLRQYQTEIRITLEGRWGTFLADASFVIEREGRPVSATLVTLWQGRPLIAQAVTSPEYQGQGMARYLIRKSLNALTELGYREAILGVTSGNLPAEHLYRQLGFTGPS